MAPGTAPGRGPRSSPCSTRRASARVALDLPSKGTDTAALGDLHDDAAVVRAAVDSAGAPALVVAHSYGGLPVSEGLAESPNAAHLIYLAAFVLAPGESLLGLRGGVEPDWWITSEDGRTVLPGDPVPTFYADCPPEVAARAAAAIVPHRKDAFRQELRAAAWQSVPSTYVVCDRDNALPPAAQEAHVGTRRHRQPHRLEPLAVPLAARGGHRDHPRDAGGRDRRGPVSAAAGGERSTWTNWAGNQSFAAHVEAPASEDEVVEHVRAAIARGSGIRALGAGHSFTPLIETSGTVLSTDRLRGITDIDAAQQRVTVLPGTRIGEFGDPLWAAGLALANQGDIETQAIAGAIATGTHGSGPRLQSFSANLRACRIVNGLGEVVEIDATTPERLRAAQVAVGMLGVMTSLTLAVVARLPIDRAHRPPAVRRRARALGRALLRPPPLLVLLASE